MIFKAILSNKSEPESGYVIYHGCLPLEELMQDDPSQRHQQEIGGMA